ncbi:MAG: hypothetical protein K8T10_11285 [Candidatus Eremiobacteraeota bacterium]|nr:hypothetical protein [Candidatus Eremiobacteraeota bacterium]
MEYTELNNKEIDEFISKLAVEIVERRLAAPAIVLLESTKPLSFVGSQTLVFFDPIVKMFVAVKDYEKYISLLENREYIEKLIVAVEEYENETLHSKKGNKDAKRGD